MRCIVDQNFTKISMGNLISVITWLTEYQGTLPGCTVNSMWTHGRKACHVPITRSDVQSFSFHLPFKNEVIFSRNPSALYSSSPFLPQSVQIGLPQASKNCLRQPVLSICAFENPYQVFASLGGRATPVVQNRTVSKGINFMKVP